MHDSSDKYHKTDFTLRVAKTIGFEELALAIQVSAQDLKNKLDGLITITDKEIEKIYQLLSAATVWEKSHV